MWAAMLARRPPSRNPPIKQNIISDTNYQKLYIRPPETQSALVSYEKIIRRTSSSAAAVEMWLSKKKGLSLLLAGLCLFSSASAGIATTTKKKQVCVVGAGATGLASIKQFADSSDEFDVVAFERNSEVGGLWIYSESVDLDEHNLPVHSSMYKYLRTNLPKELMAFPDYRHFHGDERSCVTHETVLAYLNNYTDHFNLRQYIKLNTMVDKVTPILGEGDSTTTKYSVESRDLNTNETAETSCDAIAVCNGHYFKPRMPKIPGIETFPGKLMHSHYYRKPEDFADQTVVVLGASSSGVDISIEIAEHAKTVYLSHNKDKIKSPLSSNLVQVAGVVSANGSGLSLEDGGLITADTFVYCTGYVFSYPFLDEKSGIELRDNHVLPLYKHLVNVDQPSMAFVGLPLLVVHFPLFYVQARYFVSLLRGKAKLPSRELMLADANELHGRPERYAHFLGDAQWAYNDELAEAGAFERLPSYYRNGYQIWHAYRTKNVLGYKLSNLRVHDNGDVELVHPSQNNGLLEGA
ncbi:flavin-containing monooxygenase FMO GS-OX-like 2 [Nasonia vitripennis]|uniref:Flavin-containing monooxygenase n=1 Tax=Nasonia vitripennis TaxID=7425 RepID=A0A7M7ITC8_NASVI|nr:flavin-containing monooxygenase FMO GS-OX-like 2 [Nasonia vitripennis]